MTVAYGDGRRCETKNTGNRYWMYYCNIFGMAGAARRVDALVIGAGFSGLYALHRLRELGVRTLVLETAENVGGTWLFNRYPGARCDIESIEYSYSFSDEIQQEWVWTETMPAQPEVEAYLNFVADRLDLRRDIRFDTKVIAMTFDEDAAEWVIETEAGETFVAPFVVAASGILSAPLQPDIPGIDTFAGTSLYTSRWPKAGFDLTGKRVGVIGTGSTGVQLIPVVARQAAHLCVFQRSAAYTLPWQVRPFAPGELDEMKARYGEIRAAARLHPVGAARLSAFSLLLEMISSPPLKSATREEQLRAIDENGVIGALNWGDVFFDIEADRMAGSDGEAWRSDGSENGRDGAELAGFLGDRSWPAVLSRLGGRRLPEPVHRPGTGKSLGGNKLRRRARTARGVDQRLHRPSARPRTPHDRSTARRATRVDRPHHVAGGAHRAGAPKLQFLVQRRQRSRQEKDVHGLYRRHSGIPPSLRRDRRQRVHRIQTCLAA